MPLVPGASTLSHDSGKLKWRRDFDFCRIGDCSLRDSSKVEWSRMRSGVEVGRLVSVFEQCGDRWMMMMRWDGQIRSEKLIR